MLGGGWRTSMWACLEEFEGSANVVTATSAAHRTTVHDDDGWFCELDWVVDGGRIQGAYRYPYDYCPQLAEMSRPKEAAAVPPDHVTRTPA